MLDSSTRCRVRVDRVRRAVGPIVVSDHRSLASDRPLIAITSSRLGHNVQLHRHVCQFLSRSVLDGRQRGGRLLVARGSAIEPWAVRAAELFNIPVITLSVDLDDSDADIFVHAEDASPLSRDAVVIAIADRVDAVYVRRGGTIERCLQQRIKLCDDISTRVAISPGNQCAAASLITAGAIGWYRPTRIGGRSQVSDPSPSPIPSSLDDWTRTDGRWLVHCTRGRDGPWPGETMRQYRDSILLGDAAATEREPLDALMRILRSGQLVNSSIATAKSHPVVCFSALPLAELLSRRCFRPQLGRWDYEPYGIAICISAARRLGIQSVIYGDTKQRRRLPVEDRFRFHPIGKTYDWRQEREWRSSRRVDLNQLDRDEVRVFATDTPEGRIRLQGCRWQVTWLA